MKLDSETAEEAEAVSYLLLSKNGLRSTGIGKTLLLLFFKYLVWRMPVQKMCLLC